LEAQTLLEPYQGDHSQTYDQLLDIGVLFRAPSDMGHPHRLSVNVILSNKVSS